MKQETSKICMFHFKMDEEMKGKLKMLDLYREEGNLSRLIVKILTILNPLIDKKHFSRKQEGSRYRFVHEDLTIERRSTYVYLPDYLYRRLKLMHQDLNCYSIARLLRGFLQTFLSFVDEYGEDYRKELEKMINQCKEEIKKYKFTYKSIPQLLQLIYRKAHELKLLNLYNTKFAPKMIFSL
jgi:hypothetical protein